jgi:hypothetical protein
VSVGPSSGSLTSDYVQPGIMYGAERIRGIRVLTYGYCALRSSLAKRQGWKWGNGQIGRMGTSM